MFISPLHINFLPSVCRWNASIRAVDLRETLYSEFSFTQEPFRPTASCFRKTTWSMLTKVSDGPCDLYGCNDPFRTTEVIWNGNIVVLIFRCFSYRCQISRLWESGVSFLWWPRKNFRWVFFVFLSGNIEVSPLFMSCEAVVYTRGNGAVALIHQCVVHSGSNRWHNGPDVTVDYMSTDSLTKWNSYQNICTAEGRKMWCLFIKVRTCAWDYMMLKKLCLHIHAQITSKILQSLLFVYQERVLQTYGILHQYSSLFV